MNYFQVVLAITLLILVIFVVTDLMNDFKFSLFKEQLECHCNDSDPHFGAISGVQNESHPTIGRFAHKDLNLNEGGSGPLRSGFNRAIFSPEPIESKYPTDGTMGGPGGMAGLDGLDGGGSGPMGSGFRNIIIDAQSYPLTGRPDGSLGMTPSTVGGFLNMDNGLDAGGSGPPGSAFGTAVSTIANLPDNSITGGRNLIVEPGGNEEYPNHTHGQHMYRQKTPGSDSEHGSVEKPYTYYYLENDNINEPCKSDADCKSSRCSESGFCKY